MTLRVMGLRISPNPAAIARHAVAAMLRLAWRSRVTWNKSPTALVLGSNVATHPILQRRRNALADDVLADVQPLGDLPT